MITQLYLREADFSDNQEMQFIKQVYITSFPADERRDFDLVTKLLAENSFFNIKVICNESEVLGFISYWNFEDFVYVEHFALDPAKRGGGAGSFTLKELGAQLKLPIILEVEYPEDENSRRRIVFYERAGFRLWPEHAYIQPPYSADSEELSLLLMTQGDLELSTRYEEVVAKIYEQVYQVTPSDYLSRIQR